VLLLLTRRQHIYKKENKRKPSGRHQLKTTTLNIV